jgi:hypothetical protein
MVTFAVLPLSSVTIRSDGKRIALDAFKFGLAVSLLNVAIESGGVADFSYVRHLFSPDNFHSCGWLRSSR